MLKIANMYFLTELEKQNQTAANSQTLGKHMQFVHYLLYYRIQYYSYKTRVGKGLVYILI